MICDVIIVFDEETSRWLAFVALKETYANNPEALDEAMDLLADDFLDAMSQGVLLQSHAVLRLAVVAVKGDWPFLIEAGHSERHFRRALEYVTCASVAQKAICLKMCPPHHCGKRPWTQQLRRLHGSHCPPGHSNFQPDPADAHGYIALTCFMDGICAMGAFSSRVLVWCCKRLRKARASKAGLLR